MYIPRVWNVFLKNKTRYLTSLQATDGLSLNIKRLRDGEEPQQGGTSGTSPRSYKEATNSLDLWVSFVNDIYFCRSAHLFFYRLTVNVWVFGSMSYIYHCLYFHPSLNYSVKPFFFNGGKYRTATGPKLSKFYFKKRISLNRTTKWRTPHWKQWYFF